MIKLITNDHDVSFNLKNPRGRDRKRLAADSQRTDNGQTAFDSRQIADKKWADRHTTARQQTYNRQTAFDSGQTTDSV